MKLLTYREKACVFCGDDGEALTAEHLWSAWMSPSLISVRPTPEEKRQPFTILRRSEGSQGFGHAIGRSREMNEKPKCLCHECNHETLGNVEQNFFKPLVESMMLHGTPRQLNVEDRLVIAIWAFKTLVVYNHSYNRPPFLYNNAARLKFIRSLMPPERNFRVWVGRFNVPGRSGHCTGLPLKPNASAVAQLKHVECFALTFVFGQFMFQVHVMKRIGSDFGADYVRFLPELTYWNDKASLIWPVVDHADIPWPPPKDLPEAELDKFCCRWGGLFSTNLTDIQRVNQPPPA